MPDNVEYLLWRETGYGEFDYSAFPDYTAKEIFSGQIGHVERQIKEIWHECYRDRPNRRIAIAINGNPSVHAVAIHRSDPQIISLSAGMLVRLRQMFLFAACDERVFPRKSQKDILGDAKQLRFGVKAKEILKPADLALKGALHSDNDYLHLYGPIPYTHARLGLAKSLAAAAIDFVSMHEFAHIARNHGGLMPHSQRLFSEASGIDSPVTEEERLVSRLCEVDADLTGANLSMLKFTSATTVAAVWNGWAKSPRDGLRLWLVAVMMTLMLFEGWSSGMRAREDHPHPAVRLHLMAAALMERLPESVKIPDLSDFAREAVNAARMVWVGLGLPLNRMRVLRNEAMHKSSSKLNEAYISRLLPILRLEEWRL